MLHDLGKGGVRDHSEVGADLARTVGRRMGVTDVDVDTLDALAGLAAPPPEPWPAEARQAFVSLLAQGPAAIPVVESLDHVGIWTTLLPEWDQVRALHQRNAYHRYTVDRHLLVCVANAAGLADRVDRQDLLLLAAMLHDLGKGGVRDHSEVGADLARTVGRRMGVADVDVDTLATVVSHHLLLPEVATRRDLDDPATIANVLDAVSSVEEVRILAALTEADSLATGPAAWGRWKADLVARLVDRVVDAFAGRAPALDADHFPTPEQIDRLHSGERVVEHEGSTILVMADDRPGNFSQIAGALALHGLDVIGAAAHSESDRAMSRFEVTWSEARTVRWDQVVRDVERALDRRIALSAGLAERARTYARRRPVGPPIESTVAFDDAASNDATVIDVSGPDEVGALYRITRALTELGLDIRTARAQSSAGMLNDSFYVLDHSGARVDDPELRREITRAVLDSFGEPPRRAGAP
jgi:[protein-PII] uridylyltransferase